MCIRDSSGTKASLAIITSIKGCSPKIKATSPDIPLASPVLFPTWQKSSMYVGIKSLCCWLSKTDKI